MREEFFIERQGKRMILYAGLLDAAHERGLHSISTILLQVPDDKNGRVAIVRALVTLDTAADAEDRRTFTGIGDASPDNVGRNIVPHIIRMAETRAKARALRDAVNVGMAAYEESNGDDTEERQRLAQVPREQELAPGTADASQQARLRGLIEETGHDLAKFEERYAAIEELRWEFVERWIQRLTDEMRGGSDDDPNGLTEAEEKAIDEGIEADEKALARPSNE